MIGVRSIRGRMSGIGRGSTAARRARHVCLAIGRRVEVVVEATVELRESLWVVRARTDEHDQRERSRGERTPRHRHRALPEGARGDVRLAGVRRFGAHVRGDDSRCPTSQQLRVRGSTSTTMGWTGVAFVSPCTSGACTQMPHLRRRTTRGSNRAARSCGKCPWVAVNAGNTRRMRDRLRDEDRSTPTARVPDDACRTTHADTGISPPRQVARPPSLLRSSRFA